MISCVNKVAYMIQYSERDTMGVYMIQLRVNKTVCRPQCMDHLGLYDSWCNTNGAYGIQLISISNTKSAYIGSPRELI